MPFSNPNQKSPLATKPARTSPQPTSQPTSQPTPRSTRNRRIAVTGCVVAAIVPMTFSSVRAASTPSAAAATSDVSVASESELVVSGSAHSVLAARAVLPAKTFRVGSAVSGTLLSANDRTNAGLNGIAVAGDRGSV
jgi:hypothetical protein